MSKRLQPTITDLVVLKKATKSQSNSSNVNGSRSRKQGKAKRARKPRNMNNSFAMVTTNVPIAQGTSIKNVSRGSIFRTGKKTELIGPLSSSGLGTFANLYRLRCNPASFATFNWLSQIAPNFESYKFHALRFVAITRAPTTASGSLIMSPDYDAADGSIPITEQFLFNNQGSTESPVWQTKTILNLDTKMMNRLYKAHINMTDIRFANTAQDEKTIDVAQIFIATDTNFSGNFGKLLVEYDVEFFQPQARTESINQGGAEVMVSGNGNTNFPLNSSTLVQSQEVTPLLQYFPGNAENNGGGNNTGALAQFTRDWQGYVRTSFVGTGISGIYSMFVGSKSTTYGGQDNTDIVQPISSDFYGGTGAQTCVNYVTANAGQWLKVVGPTLSTLSQVRFFLGGSSNPWMNI
jgi:hypothetical protein